MGSVVPDSNLIRDLRQAYAKFQAAYHRWSQSIKKIHLVGDESTKLRSDLWHQYVEARDHYHTHAHRFMGLLESTYKEGDPDPDLTLTEILYERA